MTPLTVTVPDDYAGQRLDQALALLFSDYSRSKLQTWNKAGRVLVDGQLMKAKERLEGGEIIILDAEPEIVLSCDPEQIDLDIVYQDDSIIIVNKPAGMVVHPGAGNSNGTLQNALLFLDPVLAALPRAGLVHRIDKDTSGLLMVAKTLQAHNYLVEQLQAREIHREYLAITQGRMTAGGMIDEPIGRHAVDRKRQAVKENGRAAVTHYRVVERFNKHTLIQVKLETGRTHQIRVHMEYIRYPLLGDMVYGGRFRLPAKCDQNLMDAIRNFKRQALHAAKLGLIHPDSHEYIEWEVPVPADMQHMIEALRDNDRRLAAG